MVKVGVIGATGYTGEELIDILIGHAQAEITSLSAIVEKPTNISEIFPRFKGEIDIICKELDVGEVIKSSDVVFLALPHTISMQFAPVFLKAGKKVIDLSADYRLPADIYEKWYGKAHTDRDNLKRAIYGLPEIHRDEIKGCDFIANPGCYPTSVILGIAPLIKNGIVELEGIIADSKSGISGAGRKAALGLIFAETADNFKAYKIGQHQHSPEITQELGKLAKNGIELLFVPHILPIKRGILSTIYLKQKKKVSQEEIDKLYDVFYKDEPFVRLLGGGAVPELKNVVGTNFCDIGTKLTENKIVAVAVIDNLTKGAAGQAVQNMNLMCGFDETEGL